MTSCSNQWTIEHFSRLKRKLVNTINSEAEAGADRLALIHAELATKSGRLEPHELMQTFILAMMAATELLRRRQWRSKEISEMILLGEQTLEYAGIKPSRSKLAFLHGDIYHIKSQWYRLQGHSFRAAWTQQLANYFGSSQTSEGPAYIWLAKGYRFLRLAAGHKANAAFTEAMANAPADSQVKIRAALGLCQTLRLQQQWSKAFTLLDETDPPADGRYGQELAWERLCLQACRHQDFALLLDATKKKASHYDLPYLAEVHLWALAQKRKTLTSAQPKLSSIVRAKKFTGEPKSDFIRFVMSFEDLYDTVRPFANRLEKVENLVEQARQTVLLDKELLALAALIRWLVRNKAQEFASLLMCRYEALGLSLSGGAFRDPLRLIEDLFERQWHKTLEAQKPPKAG